jgi:aspartyl-tRNA(Asn)/glutamyl-tRNA(Gln) amidotransferase subunit A
MAERDWTKAAAHQIAEAVRAGTVTALAITEAHLARIAALNTKLGAYTDLTAARARAQAAAVDAARARGEALGALAGVPFAVKNLFDIAGISTRAGSKINRDLPVADADATLITRLEATGAVLLGALNMGEYAYDFTGRSVHDGPSRNPHDLERMTGGSSGGSGAAAAGGLAALTLGSDTNGSIRVPSALCGLFGLKPTFGALSRARSFPFVSSLDHLGPMARSTRDLALAFDAMAGPDPADPFCWRDQPAPVTPTLDHGIAGLRIAVAGGYFRAMGMPEAFAVVDQAADALGARDRIDWPEAGRARAAAFVMTMIEGGTLHRARLQSRMADFDAEVRDRLIAGNLLPGAMYVQAQKYRRHYCARVMRLFEQHDVFLAPATPCTAPFIEQKTFVLDGQELPVRANLGLFTQPISFAGLPVAVAPMRAPDGMPLGVQIIAAPGREDLVLRVSATLEKAGIASAPVAEVA